MTSQADGLPADDDDELTDADAAERSAERTTDGSEPEPLDAETVTEDFLEYFSDPVDDGSPASESDVPPPG